MKFKNIILLGLLTMLFIGCESKLNNNLLKISQSIEVDPDSAMTKLYQLDTTKLSNKEKAERRVLLSQAYNLCGYSISSDSLIKPALDYYQKHGDNSENTKAWYYYANVLSNANNIDEAVKCYLQAAWYAQNSKESDQYLAAIYYHLGALYSAQKYNDEAIAYFDKAINLSLSVQNEKWHASAVFMKSMLLYASHKFDEAISTLKSVQSNYSDDIMSEWVDLILLHYIVAGDLESNDFALEQRNKIDRSKIAQIKSLFPNDSFSDSPVFVYDAVSSIIFLKNNQLDSASYYVEKAISEMSTPQLGNVGMYVIASSIYESKGNTSTALEYQKYYNNAVDSIYRAERDVQVLSIEQKYHQKYESDLQISKHKHRLHISILVAIILLAMVFLAIKSYRKKLRQRDVILSDYLALIESYKETHDGLLSKLKTTDEREATIKEFLGSRFAIIKDIAATYYTYGESKFIVEKMKQLALSPSMLNDIIQMSDFYNENSVTKLKEQFPEWTTRNYEFAALVIAGFSAQEISVMLDMTLNGVYTLKSKLKRRIVESDAIDKDVFIEYLS